VSPNAAAEIFRIDRVVTTFIDEWTVRAKRRHALGRKLAQLDELLSPGGDPVHNLEARLTALSQWLKDNAGLTSEPGVRRAELEVLVVAAEKLVQLREKSDAPAAAKTHADALLDRLVALIREGTGRLGLEYTPAGLVEASEAGRRESERVRQSLLDRLRGFEDVKAAYKKALAFQKERLDYFYQEDTHLLSVLDYQLKNLEARPSVEDEFFAACLIYFLKQHNYQVAPYVKRFRQAVGASDAMASWGGA
jgi:hypothetical protein